MGTITRHAGAPFQDGETLAGADLESDIAGAYDAINGNIDTVNLKNNAVTTAKIANGAVTQAKLDGTLVATVADDGVTTVKILDLNVTTPKINDAAVTTVKINDDAVTQKKILYGSAASVQSSFNHGSTTLTGIYASIATSVHPTGDPAHIVAVMVSFTAFGSGDAGRSIEYYVQKDGTSLLGSGNADSFSFSGSGSMSTQITRVYIDASPTSASSHTYILKVKYAGGTAPAPAIKDVVWYVHETRS